MGTAIPQVPNARPHLVRDAQVGSFAFTTPQPSVAPTNNPLSCPAG